MTTVFYARTSTSDQNPAHQRTQAEALGFRFDHVLVDDGVSGVTTRLSERPQGRRLFDLLRAGDALVVRWVDRLGRNYLDVSDNLREFMRRGVVVHTVINNMVFDGSTADPVQMAVRDSLIAFMAATAQAQAEVIREAQRAGIEHAKNSESSYRGRKPSYTLTQGEKVVEMLARNVGVSEIARVLGLSRQTVYRIKKDPAEALAAARAWE